MSALMYCKGTSCAALKEGTAAATALLAASSGATAEATTSPPNPTNCRLDRVTLFSNFSYGGKLTVLTVTLLALCFNMKIFLQWEDCEDREIFLTNQ